MINSGAPLKLGVDLSADSGAQAGACLARIRDDIAARFGVLRGVRVLIRRQIKRWVGARGHGLMLTAGISAVPGVL